MYRVLLVDDESLTLDYLKMAIPKQDPDWESPARALTASRLWSGLKAIQRIWF